jgi:phosphoribosylamine--glycine ligase
MISDARCVPVAATDAAAMGGLIEDEGIDLTVVGPEAPLVAGLADSLRAKGHPVFGPGADGARLEGSKAWAKDLCERYGIAAPASRSFDDSREAVAWLDELEAPYVVKADGLAAGKGVIIAADRSEARAAIHTCMTERAFGDAGSRVLIEEFLEGREISALALTDGERIVPLALAQDFKRVGEGDTGPNTGGMGAYSPLDWVDPEIRGRIEEEVLAKALSGLRSEGIDYRGVIYAGLMLTAEGPKVLEFNCRFGDPETQVILPRLTSSLAEALMGAARGDLGGYAATWTQESCVTVCAVSGGYPGDFATGIEIRGLEEAAAGGSTVVFHSGTSIRNDRVVTAGGRVLAVTALGQTLAGARERAYSTLSRISFEGMAFRRDIAAAVAAGSSASDGGTSEGGKG